MSPVCDPANGEEPDFSPDPNGEPARDEGAEPIRRGGGVPRALLDDDAVFVVRRLQQHGHEAYLVGGCVRDVLCGLEPKDFDVATDAHPNRIKRIFRNARVIGRRFRLVHVRFPHNHVIEVSTFRADPAKHAPIDDEDVGGRGRDWRDSAENIFGTATEDAYRRDFTINALYYDPVEDEVLDWVGGLEDLERKRIESIGPPIERIHEDPVRMLRAVHFAERMDFDLAGDLAAAIRSESACLNEASQARLYVELIKLLSRGRARRTFEHLFALGVLQEWLPELCQGLDDEMPSSDPGPVRTVADATWDMLEAADRWGMAQHKAPESLALASLFGPWLLATTAYTRRRTHTAFVDSVDDRFRRVAVRMSIPRWASTEMREALWALGALREPPSDPRRVSALMRRRSFPVALRLFAFDLTARRQSMEAYDAWVDRAQEARVGHEFRPPQRPQQRRTRGGRRRPARRGGRRRGASRRPRDVTPEADAWMPPPDPSE